MKIIFLDIDGVLNSSQWFQGDGRVNDRPLGHLDPAACARVQRICDATQARICVSSTWRLIHKRPKLVEMFRLRGITAEVVGQTPQLPGSDQQRGDEICLWLSKHPEVTKYIVLDDDSDMRGVHHRFIQTSFAEGLTDELADRAIAMLNEE